MTCTFSAPSLSPSSSFSSSELESPSLSLSSLTAAVAARFSAWQSSFLLEKTVRPLLMLLAGSAVILALTSIFCFCWTFCSSDLRRASAFLSSSSCSAFSCASLFDCTSARLAILASLAARSAGERKSPPAEALGGGVSKGAFHKEPAGLSRLSPIAAFHLTPSEDKGLGTSFACLGASLSAASTMPSSDMDAPPSPRVELRARLEPCDTSCFCGEIRFSTGVDGSRSQGSSEEGGGQVEKHLLFASGVSGDNAAARCLSKGCSTLLTGACRMLAEPRSG